MAKFLLEIPDELQKKIKIKAVEKNQTMNELMNEILKKNI